MPGIIEKFLENRALVMVLRVVVFSYIGLLVLLYFNQGSILFVPSQTIEDNPKTIGLPFEFVQFETSDRLHLSGWFIPANTKEAYVILQCHGNAGNISNRLSYGAIFSTMGLHTLLFDYRGYGYSQGKPSEEGLYQDALAAWKYLVEERHFPPQKIIVYGESLGGGVASYLAKERTIGGLILASTFTSVTDRAAEIYPFLPIRWISRFAFNTHDRLPKIKAPVLIIHSPTDEIIPFHHGKKNFAVANELKMFLEIQGDHNYGFLESGETYTQGIQKFIDTYIAPASKT